MQHIDYKIRSKSITLLSKSEVCRISFPETFLIRKTAQNEYFYPPPPLNNYLILKNDNNIFVRINFYCLLGSNKIIVESKCYSGFMVNDLCSAKFIIITNSRTVYGDNADLYKPQLKKKKCMVVTKTVKI